MITKKDVEKFLENFYVKVKIFGIQFRDDRKKNRDSLFFIGHNTSFKGNSCYVIRMERLFRRPNYRPVE